MIRYIAIAIDDETDEVISKVSAGSEEGLEEEMGKRKWSAPIKDHQRSKQPQDNDQS